MKLANPCHLGREKIVINYFAKNANKKINNVLIAIISPIKEMDIETIKVY